VPGEETVAHGVTIVGDTNLPSTMASDASRLYARNVVALVELLVADGELNLDWEDEIVAGTCVTRAKETGA
jgi:NAD(P) transhydrogenase subunit alpha